MSSDGKRELLQLIEHKAFDPVMRAKSDGRSEAEQKKLERLQKATKAEIERYRRYDSAEQLLTNFKRDLSSKAAKKVHAELHSLHLPTIEDIRDEVEQRANELELRA
jgi:hypothetical protein